MAESKDYRSKVQRKLEDLDMKNGLGIFTEAQYNVVPGTRFLIVSYGGTGADALEAVKEKLERYMSAEELEDKVAYLALDTSKEEANKSVTVQRDGVSVTETRQRFEPQEFFWIDNVPGRQALLNNDPGILQWSNPKLPDAVRADPTLMNGSGASGIRQSGRVMLYPAQIYTNFQQIFTNAVRRLTDNNADKLKIFVLSGISGGTGSGIIIDATYLMHHFISQMSGGIPARTVIAGFILLPPTGKSSAPVDIEKGNRNGIAALKEIDRFMTVAQRGEAYVSNLGGKEIIVNQNIFETCYLLDGSTDQVAFGNAREKANTVVSDCILDMISAKPSDNGKADGNTQMVDAFMSDASTFARAMIQTEDEKNAPREANYVYCALGHGKTMIPLNLMKAYVAKRCFDHMYKSFLNCGKVTPDEVKKFTGAIKTINGNLPREIDKRLESYFRDESKGPYYVINLLRDSMDEIRSEYNTLQGKTLVLDKQAKLDKLRQLMNILSTLNTSTFDVYVTVMEEMRKYLDAEHKIICDSSLLESYGGSTYTFCPINFGGTDEKSAVVQKYLDSLVSRKRVDALIRALIKEMADHRKEWTDLVTGTKAGQIENFNAAKRIRVFWQSSIDKIVSATVEDYLLKLYSGDPNASWPESGDPDPATDEAMKKAANAIVTQMWGAAGLAKPLVDLRTDILIMDKFNGHNTLLIPKAAPHLKDYVKAALAGTPSNKLTVAESEVNDRISCYSQYTGIPAYMFGWVGKAEGHYEKMLAADNVGLHMSETRTGEQWANIPNLLVESIWPKINPNYFCEREHNIGQEAKDVFTRACEFGLGETHPITQTGVGNVYYYDVFRLASQFLPAHQLLKDTDIEVKGTTAHDRAVEALEADVQAKAEALFKLVDWNELDAVSKDGTYLALSGLKDEKGRSLVRFEKQALQFPNTVMSPLISAGRPKPEGWEEELAAKLLRTLPDFMDDLRGTVLVLEALYPMIEKAQAGERLMREFSHYMVTGLIKSNDDGDEWSYWDSEEEEEVKLVELLAIDDVQMGAKEYYVYQEFLHNADRVIAGVQPQYKELIYNEETGKLDMGKLKDLRKQSQDLAAVVKEFREAKKGISSLAFAKMAKELDHDENEVAEIKEFYKSYEKELSLGRMQVLA